MEPKGGGHLTLRSTIAEHFDDPELSISAWDDLAVELGQPYAAPDWCLAWWRCVAPSSARLRVVSVYRDVDLVGLAAFYCDRTRLGLTRYRLLGAGTSPRMQPLAQRGAEAAVAETLTEALADVRPRPDIIEFSGITATEDWSSLFTDSWPHGRVRSEVTSPVSAPAVTLHGDYDQWLAAKSRNFRQQTRRHRRHLIDEGAVFRLVNDAGEAVNRLSDFQRLHESRWRYRGGSGVLDRSVMAMLRQCAASMVPQGRFLLHLIEIGDQVIGAHVYVAAGGELTYWLGGFDERWAKDQPSMQSLVDLVEWGFASGRQRLDLGPGAQPYKLRLSDHEEQLVDATLYPPSARRSMAVASHLPKKWYVGARQRVIRGLTIKRKDQLKRVLRRLRG